MLCNVSGASVQLSCLTWTATLLLVVQRRQMTPPLEKLGQIPITTGCVWAHSRPLIRPPRPSGTEVKGANSPNHELQMRQRSCNASRQKCNSY
jgi:hypothetical protein